MMLQLAGVLLSLVFISNIGNTVQSPHDHPFVRRDSTDYQSTAPQTTTATAGDNRRRRPGEDFRPEDYSDTGNTAAGSSQSRLRHSPDTCDNIPDDISLSCLNQEKLKEYCHENFRAKAQCEEKSNVDRKSELKKYFVEKYIKANWFQAQGHCKARHMSLATVESAEEQKALSSALDNTGLLTAWISGNDLEKPGNFTWAPTGQPIVWTAWDSGEPNQNAVDNQTENCIEVIGNRWQWKNNLCYNQENFVCQYFSRD